MNYDMNDEKYRLFNVISWWSFLFVVFVCFFNSIFLDFQDVLTIRIMLCSELVTRLAMALRNSLRREEVMHWMLNHKEKAAFSMNSTHRQSPLEREKLKPNSSLIVIIQR